MFGEDRRCFFPRRDVEEAGSRIECRVIPVRPALIAGVHADPGARRLYGSDGFAFGVEATHPIYFHERLAEQEFAGRAVQYIENTIAIGPDHDLARPALP